jgi:hypothetical protein
MKYTAEPNETMMTFGFQAMLIKRICTQHQYESTNITLLPSFSALTD